VRETVPWVRIPLSPPLIFSSEKVLQNQRLLNRRFGSGVALRCSTLNRLFTTLGRRLRSKISVGSLLGEAIVFGRSTRRLVSVTPLLFFSCTRYLRSGAFLQDQIGARIITFFRPT
jgi:hypothetical protein